MPTILKIIIITPLIFSQLSYAGPLKVQAKKRKVLSHILNYRGHSHRKLKKIVKSIKETPYLGGFANHIKDEYLKKGLLKYKNVKTPEVTYKNGNQIVLREKELITTLTFNPKYFKLKVNDKTINLKTIKSTEDLFKSIHKIIKAQKKTKKTSFYQNMFINDAEAFAFIPVLISVGIISVSAVAAYQYYYAEDIEKAKNQCVQDVKDASENLKKIFESCDWLRKEMGQKSKEKKKNHEKDQLKKSSAVRF